MNRTGRPRGRTAVRLVLAVTALAAFLPVLVAGAGRAGAQQALSMRLVSQPLWVAPDGVATFVLDIDGPVPAEATVVVIAHNRAFTRGEVRQAIDEGIDDSPLDLVEYPIAALPVQDGLTQLVLETRTVREVSNRLLLRNPGLYPLAFELRVEDEPVAELMTFLERTDATAPAAVVRTAVGVSLDAPPTLAPDGSTRIDDETRARVDQLIDLLELTTTVPLTVTIRPELLEGLARSGLAADRTRLDRLAAALAQRHQLLASTYVAMDPSIAIRDDLGIEFTQQLRTGEDVVRETLGITVDRITWLLRDPIDTEGTDLLRLFGVKHLLASSAVRDDLPRRDGGLGAVAGSDGVVLPALLGDLVVQARLADDTDDPVLRAHHVLADLLAMSIEDEAVAAEDDSPVRPVGVFVDLGEVGSLDTGTVATLLALLDDSPRVEVATGGAAIETLDRETPTTLRDRFPMRDIDPARTDAVAASLARLREAVASTTTMLPSDDVRPPRWNQLTDVFAAANLTAEQRASYTRQLDGEIGDVRACVAVVTSERVSLGGRESRVPLTLVNECEVPLRVRVRLNGPKLELREPDQVVTVVDREQLEIPVEARTNGVFPVEVELLTPGGEPAAQLGRPTEFTVQATALAGLGQLVSGALVLVLITWWVQHVRGRRRRSRAEQAAAHVSSHPAARVEAG